MKAKPTSATRTTSSQKWLNRFARLRLPIAIAALVGLLLPYLQQPASIRALNLTEQKSSYSRLVTAKQTADEVTPADGFQTRIVLGDVIPKMVSAGVIDISKFKALYKNTNMPDDEMKLLTQTSTDPLVVNADNARWIVNLLWPIGLANHMKVNELSPIAGKYVNGFASTGGWNLGKSNTGGVYFNKYSLVSLTQAQEKRVRLIAGSSYRPCCNNSSFFQDCNHGSAAMALIELGVSQGLSDQEIYRTLVEFNSFWFPNNYVEAAVYLKSIENIQWENADPKLVMSGSYSSSAGSHALHPFASTQLPIPDFSPLQLTISRGGIGSGSICGTGTSSCGSGRCGSQLSCSGCSGCASGGCAA